MFRLFKYLFILAVLVAIGVGVYALFGDLPAPVGDISQPVQPMGQ